MANKEISQLTEKSTPVGSDEIEIQETGGGASKRATLTNVFDALIADDLLGSASVSASGSSVEFTGVPADMTRIYVTVRGLSVSSADDIDFLIGGDSGYSSVYSGGYSQFGTGVTTVEEDSTHVIFDAATNQSLHGVITLTREFDDDSWVITSMMWAETGTSETAISISSADIGGGGDLTKFKLEVATGSFDTGVVSAIWE